MKTKPNKLKLTGHTSYVVIPDCAACVNQGAIKTVPWTRRDITYLNYDIVKQEITKVHRALHRQIKAFGVHLRQPVSPLLTDSDAESIGASSVDCRFRASSHIDVLRFCVDATEVEICKSNVFFTLIYSF